MAKRPTKTETDSVNTFRDMQGEVITDRAFIAAVYRGLADDSDAAEELTDNQIFTIVSSIPGDDIDPDTQAERLNAVNLSALSKAEAKEDQKDIEPVPVKVDLGTGKALAPLSAIPKYKQPGFAYGQLLDETFEKHCEVAANSKENFDGAPLLICEDLERIYGEKREGDKIVQEKLYMNFPIPGSGTEAWKTAHPGWNGPTDAYKITIDGTTVTGRFVGDMFDATKRGKHYLEQMRMIDHLKDDTAVALPGTPQKYIDIRKSKVKLAAERQRWASRRNNSINRLAKAIRFLQQKEALKEFSQIRLQLATKNIEEAARMPKPILLFSPGKELPNGEREMDDIRAPMSLSAFCNLKLDRLNDLPSEQQTLEAAMQTVQRAGKSGTGATGRSAEGLDINIDNTKQFTAALYGMGTYLFDSSNVTSVTRILNGNTPEKAELLEALFDIKPRMELLWKQNEAANNARIKAQEDRLEQERKAATVGKSKAA